MRKVADLSVEELKELISATVWETLQDFLDDPDEGLELQDWVKERLRQSLAARRWDKKAFPLKQVAHELSITRPKGKRRERV
ncbi:MAG: hypothetical protein KEFWMYNX_001082 [Candidatus Fervidibacter sp.]